MANENLFWLSPCSLGEFPYFEITRVDSGRGVEMKNPAASSGVSKKTHFERNCRVGGGAKRRYPPGGERWVSLTLNPSYARIAAQQAAGN